MKRTALNRFQLLAFQGFACLLILLCGCSDQLPTYPVKGRVEFESGAPVVMGTVEFQSIDHSLNSRGKIQSDGSFELTTFSENDGAVAGEHKCVILQMVIGENMPGFRPSKIGVVDPAFASYLTSGLTCTVTEDGDNEITLTVHGLRDNQPDPGTNHKH